jgi:vanillate O-demethylase monooxygenase subunit
VLEAVHRGMSEKTTPNLDLGIDSGPLRFRWRMKELIEAEGMLVGQGG